MTEYFTGNYKRVIKEQPIRVSDCLEYEPRESNVIATITICAVGIATGLFVMAGIKACDKPKAQPVKECLGCHRQVAMTNYFKKNGSKSPEEMAYAVLNTKSPRLLAAIAVRESNANPSVRRTGYKKRHHGAFQVNPRYHGRVPTNGIEQALQAEAILNELTETMSIKKALSRYGGDSTDHYSKQILAELTRVP